MASSVSRLSSAPLPQSSVALVTTRPLQTQSQRKRAYRRPLFTSFSPIKKPSPAYSPPHTRVKWLWQNALLDPEGVLSFTEAVGELIDVCISFNRKHPRVSSPRGRRTAFAFRPRRQAGSRAGLRRFHRGPPPARAARSLSLRSDPPWVQVALMIFRGILDELTVAFAARPSAPAAGHAQCRSPLPDTFTHGIESGRYSVKVRPLLVDDIRLRLVNMPGRRHEKIRACSRNHRCRNLTLTHFVTTWNGGIAQVATAALN